MRENELLAWVASLVQKAQKNKMYGEIVIKMESGVIDRVYEKKTMKPPKKKDS